MGIMHALPTCIKVKKYSLFIFWLENANTLIVGVYRKEFNYIVQCLNV